MPVTTLSQNDLIELWRRVNPPSYTVPIEDEQNGQGFDVPSAQAAIFAAADAESDALFQEQYLKPYPTQTNSPAAGGAKATATIQVLRTTSTVGDLVLSAGTRLLVQQQGSLGQTIELMDFLLTQDETLPEGDRGPFSLLVQAEFESDRGNVAAGSIVGFRSLGRAQLDATVDATDAVVRNASAPGALTDRFTLGMVGRYVTIVGAPSGTLQPRKIVAVDVVNQRAILSPGAFAVGDVGSTVSVEVVELEDLGLEVTQASAAAGGRVAFLDAIGDDRRVGRVAGEDDTAYRTRVCEVVDTVSPGAIERTTQRILSHCGVNWQLQETRDVQRLKGFVWDIDPYDFGSIAPVPRDPLGSLYGEGAVWMSLATAWRFFIVRVGFGNDGEFGGAYDATNPTNPNAWDSMFWDGQPVGYLSCIGQLWQALNAIRMGGIAFRIVRDPTL